MAAIFYEGPLLKPGFIVNEGFNNSAGIKLKPERISFIPPKSNYFRSQFYLLPVKYYKFDINTEYTETKRNDKPKKTTKVYEKEFSKNNSPLVFRNFLAFSLTEDFENEFYIDNEFYLSKMLEMDYRHFKYRQKDDNGNEVYFQPYKNQTSFYLEVPEDASIQNRIKYGIED